MPDEEQRDKTCIVMRAAQNPKKCLGGGHSDEGEGERVLRPSANLHKGETDKSGKKKEDEG